MNWQRIKAQFTLAFQTHLSAYFFNFFMQKDAKNCDKNKGKK